MVILLTDDVDAQLHGCLLSMGAADQLSVTPHLTNFAAASGASFTRRENTVSNDALRRQSMVYTRLCRVQIAYFFYILAYFSESV